MEFASKVRWIVVITLFVLALLLVGWGLVSIANNLFRDNGSDSSIEEPSTSFSVQSTGVASYTLDGPIVANENQRSYTIAVSENTVTMKVYKSYGQVLINQTSHKNTAAAYETFLSALENANVTALRRNASTEFAFSDQGTCAMGRRYFVELDSAVLRWSTSCSSKEGNAGFSMGPVTTLFQQQVPDFQQMTNGLGI